MENVIKEYLEQVKVGRKQVYKNMALFPLLSDFSLSLDFILMEEVIVRAVNNTLDNDTVAAIVRGALGGSEREEVDSTKRDRTSYSDNDRVFGSPRDLCPLTPAFRLCYFDRFLF